jgi:hypothetical protein
MPVFPKELPIPSRSFAERGYNILRQTVVPRGSHFTAMEPLGLSHRTSENSSIDCARIAKRTNR